MEIKAILFDLDGTLLPMDYDAFVKTYFEALAMKLAPMGYEPQKLTESIWKGTAAMIKNDGSCRNEEAFWRIFKEIYGEDSMKDKPVIDSFYSNEFVAAKENCGYASESAQIVEMLRNAGKKVILATNPIFPAVATLRRMQWAGLSAEDFDYYTTYENSCHSKPNPEYYLDILSEIGCKPQECLMVGNDVEEDMIPAEAIGMKVFLLTDCLLNKENREIDRFPHGNFNDLKQYLADLLIFL